MTQPVAARVNRYGSIATEIYDLDKPFHRLPDTAFYLSRLEGETGEILEPGCGSGRTLIPLLEAGHRAAGFDTSADMLTRCRERCAKHGFAADLSQQSLSDFTYERKFAVIILPVSTFTLIPEFADASGVLKRFHAALQKSGRLIFDITPLASLPDRGPDRRHWTAANGDLLTLEGVRTGTDFLKQTIQARYRYERWRDGVLIDSQIDLMQQRFWGVDEMRLLLQACGFREVIVTPDYRPGGVASAATRGLTFEARSV